MTREEAMVVVQRDASGTPIVWCDPEIVDLVTALNNGGLATVASCSGHGEKPGFIALRDGRVLRLFDSLEAAHADENPPLATPVQDEMLAKATWFRFCSSTGEFTGEHCSVRPHDDSNMVPMVRVDVVAAALSTPPPVAASETVSEALEMALCAPTWAGSLGHVHNALAALRQPEGNE